MVITSSTPAATPRVLNQPAKDGNGGGDAPKPDAVDAFSSGASKGGNFANGLIGAWNGGVAGVVTGAAIGLGGSALSTGLGVLSGKTQVTLSTLMHTAGTAGLAAAGGGIAGALIGCFAAKGLGHVVGNIGASASQKFGGSAELGRAIGTVGTGVMLGTFAGLGVAGYHGAAVAATCAAVGGAVAYFKS